MTTNVLNNCVFCNDNLTKDNKSKEHIIPQWLIEFLKLKKENIQPTHFSSNGLTVSTRFHTLDGLLAGRVCNLCNGEWMSNLEQEAIPIIKPLITGDMVVIDLNDIQRQILARWTAKTAYTLNSASNYFKNVPANHYNFIRENTNSLPPKVCVFGQQHHGMRPFYWMQSAIWHINGDSEILYKVAEEIKSNSYKISFQFGKLMLLIAYLPVDNVYPAIWKGIHVPLLPKSGKCGIYDKEEFPWEDSTEALVAFHCGLKAIIY